MKTGMSRWLREERFFVISAFTAIAFYLFSDVLFGRLSSVLQLATVFCWLFIVVLGCAFAVVRRVDRLVERLGEPYGTLILTLCIGSVR